MDTDSVGAWYEVNVFEWVRRRKQKQIFRHIFLLGFFLMEYSWLPQKQAPIVHSCPGQLGKDSLIHHWEYV